MSPSTVASAISNESSRMSIENIPFPRNTPTLLSKRGSECDAMTKRTLVHRHVGLWPILLQNSKVAGPQIFRKKTEREVIADSYNLNRITKVACEFVARR